MTTKTETLAQEVEALELIGSTELPEELVLEREEYNALNAEIAKLEARKNEIKIHAALVGDSMGVSMFTVDGVKAFGYNDTTKTEVDRKMLEAEFPEVAAKVIKTRKGKSFYSAK